MKIEVGDLYYSKGLVILVIQIGIFKQRYDDLSVESSLILYTIENKMTMMKINDYLMLHKYCKVT